MNPYPVIVQHVIFHVGLDMITQQIRMPLHLCQQAFALGLEIEIGENNGHNKNRHYYAKDQFEADFFIEHSPPAKPPVISSLSVCWMLAKDI